MDSLSNCDESWMNQRFNPKVKPSLRVSERLGATLILLGLQFTWTVELSYGTPFLESLGMDKAFTALVWLAGPISGLLIQPIVGVLSDRCKSRFGRRRPFIFFGTLAVLFSLFLIVYCRELGSSPSHGRATSLSISIAVFGFYILDFAINCIQGSSRALIVDIASTKEQDVINAYASFMISLGSIAGYATGFLDLEYLFNVHGQSSQFMVFCLISSAILIITTCITCLSIQEQVISDSIRVSLYSNDGGRKKTTLMYYYYVLQPFKDVLSAFRRLPSPIQKVCNVQFFAWLGWFPFLFYSSTYVAQYAAKNRRYSELPSTEASRAIRMGSRAFFFFSVVSFGLSIIVPYLRSRLNISLRKIWFTCEILFSFVMLLTFWVSDVTDATLIVTSLGYSWAIATWVPFALIGQALNSNACKSSTSMDTLVYREEFLAPDEFASDSSIHVLESGNRLTNSQMPMYMKLSKTQDDDFMNGQESLEAPESASLSTGVILGIHNIYVVLPQLTTALLGFLIFALLPDEATPPIAGTKADAIGWLFRIGGVMALVAAYLIGFLPKF